MIVRWACLALPALALAVTAVQQMGNLVTFGDSYTDEGRFNYFFKHLKPPPIGEMLPPSSNTRSGGASWGRIVANATGAQYYNYAIVGAMCTNKTDLRYVNEIQAPFPSVLEYEIETFEQDICFEDLYPDRRPDNTVYALWIGTNDLGIAGFLTDTQRKGTTLSTFVECVWATFDRIYKSGGRQFVLLNELALEHAPLYTTPYTGLGNYKYWNNKSAYNVTEHISKVREYTTSVNTMFDYGAPFQLRLQERWPGASFSIFDVHSLLQDIFEDPTRYLGDHANVKAPYRICLDECADNKGDRHSFMWFDELHPTEKMHQIFAHHFTEVVRGKSEYGTYWTT